MGKATKNEQVKLTATYFNNIAVGTMVAGVVVPYFALFSTIVGQIDDDPVKNIQMLAANWKTMLLGLVSIAVCAYASIYLHNAGKRNLEALED